MAREFPFFSGKQSKDLWADVNNAKSIADVRKAMYHICCRLQELETYIEMHTHDIVCGNNTKA